MLTPPDDAGGPSARGRRCRLDAMPKRIATIGSVPSSSIDGDEASVAFRQANDWTGRSRSELSVDRSSPLVAIRGPSGPRGPPRSPARAWLT